MPSSGCSRPSSSSSRVVLPAPFGPVIPIRSRALTCRVTGPSVKRPACSTASFSVATTELDRGAGPTLNCSAHSLRGSSTSSSRAIRDSIWRTFCACFSADSTLALRRILSLSGLFLIALRTPWLAPLALRPGPARPGRPSCRRTPRTPPGRAGGPPPARPGTRRSRRRRPRPGAGPGRARRPGSRSGPGTRGRGETSTTPPRSPRTKDSSGSRPARSRSLVGSSSSTRSKRLSSRRGEPGPGRLAAGQAGHRACRRSAVEAEVGQHRRDPLVQVGGAAGQPAVQGHGVRVVGAVGSGLRAPRRPPPSPRWPRRSRYAGPGSRRRSPPAPARAPAAASR